MTNAPGTETASTEGAQERPLVTVEPHRWALSWWARIFRRIARRWTVHSHVRKFCQPLTIDGAEKLDGLDGPLLIIANHTSHFDTVIVLDLLPNRIYDRTAIVAAADRMYRQRIKGMWHSLRYNAFPITRGGGLKSLAYSQWLLDRGWSLLIFPEGRRSRTGELQKFHPGPAFLAIGQLVPVLPIYISGASAILPPGTRESKPAPVHVRIGDVISFEDGTEISEARRAMEQAMRTLASPGN
ncbi:MAG: lysophospholipid acyltransferase family protein [Dehalococcoidia bacterium]